MKNIYTTINDFLNTQHNHFESIETWHGSPHSFDNFSLDKVDSGIGSQAYGWGIYFTSIKDVAIGYAKSLEGNAEVLIDGIEPSPFIIKYVTNIIKLHGNKKDLVLIVLKSNAPNLLKDKKISQDEYDFIINAKKLTAKRGRTLYHVELHKGKTPNEYDYMDWTSDITQEQIKKIEAQIKKTGYVGRVSIENGKIYKNVGGKEEIKKGKSVYYALSGDVGFSPKKASLFLLDAGIDGIKYPSNGGWDYVVFDTNSISINRKTKY